MKTFCFKLYKSERNNKLHKQINAAGLTYNHCIALHKRYYKIFHRTLNTNKLKVHLTKLKKISKFSYLLEIGSQAVQDVAFSEFVNILKYEASKFGTEIIEVNRYFASSQICHCCGEKNAEVKDLRRREWRCPKCGAKHDRDRNAAINILNEGLGHRPLQETP